VGLCVPDTCLRRAAWYGARVILRQVSPESTATFDLIIELYLACQGNWESLALHTGVSKADVESFLAYAAVFLGNIGNYYVSTYLCFLLDWTC
jgi:dipeptidyl-peptidase-3